MLRDRAIACLICLTLIGPMKVSAQDFIDCGSIENAYGPFDYTNPQHFSEKLPIVEDGHFDRGVEQLKGHLTKPGGDVMLGADIDYTLRAFPNHHRALYTMLRYYLDMVPRGSVPLRYSAECYFSRAKELAPADATTRMLEGIYLLRINRPTAARESLEAALQLAPNSAEIHYNAGLGYVDLNEYGLAREHAERAYYLGYPLMGLKNKLKRLGEWEAKE